jgi:hypothetical protein
LKKGARRPFFLPFADEANALVEIDREIVRARRSRFGVRGRLALARHEPANDVGNRGRSQWVLGLDGG